MSAECRPLCRPVGHAGSPSARRTKANRSLPGLERWQGPYVKQKGTPTDPWGHPYHYRIPGEHGAYDLYSLGADDAPGGTGDNQDVTNW